MASSTRSTRGRSPTATPTAWATSPASSSIWTTWSGSASTASGSRPSPSRPTPTGATTSRTSAPSRPSSARWTTSTDSSPRRGQRGIRVLMDIVPNHTSDQHPWFLESRSSRTAARRDWYLWADGATGGGPPNNWVSSFGGPGWTFDETTGQYYFHNHLAEQPDLNWWNEEVRDTFDGIFRFWSDRGVAGFRIDVCNVIIKDAELRDNPPATEDDDFETQMFGQRSVYNANRPEVHDVIRRWRRLADGYDEPRLLIGETPVPLDTLADVLRRRARRARAGLQLRLHRRAPRRRRHAGHRRAHRGGAAARRMAGVDRLQPRHVPLPHPLGGGRSPPRSAWRSSCCSACAAPRCSIRATRSAWATSPWPTRTCGTRSGCASTRTTRGATPAGPPCSGATAPAAASPTPTGRGSRSATWRPPTWPRSGTTRTRS